MKSTFKILPGFLSSKLKYGNVLERIDMNVFVKKYIEETGSVCSICLNICNLSCKPNRCEHIFCFVCLNAWSHNKKICPMCRRSFTRIIQL